MRAIRRRIHSKLNRSPRMNRTENEEERRRKINGKPFRLMQNAHIQPTTTAIATTTTATTKNKIYMYSYIAFITSAITVTEESSVYMRWILPYRVVAEWIESPHPILCASASPSPSNFVYSLTPNMNISTFIFLARRTHHSWFENTIDMKSSRQLLCVQQSVLVEHLAELDVHPTNVSSRQKINRFKIFTIYIIILQISALTHFLSHIISTHILYIPYIYIRLFHWLTHKFTARIFTQNWHQVKPQYYISHIVLDR